jgi:hypothetical protein
MNDIYRTLAEKNYAAACAEGQKMANEKGLTGRDAIRFVSSHVNATLEIMSDEQARTCEDVPELWSKMTTIGAVAAAG